MADKKGKGSRGALRMAAAKLALADDTGDASKFIESVEGVALNCLPLEAVMGVDAIPNGTVVTITGPPKAGKTTLAWHLGRNVIMEGGLVVHIRSEPKENPQQILAILGDDSMFENVLRYPRCHTLEDMFDHLTKFVKWYDANCPDGDIPVMFIVDSLGCFTKETISASVAKGGPNQAMGMQLAQAIKGYLRDFLPNYFEGRPFSMALINHEYGSSDTKGDPESTGGLFAKYIQSWLLRMRYAGSTSTVDGVKPKAVIKCTKNSWGPTDRFRAEVPLTTIKTEPDQSSTGYRLYLDWEEAACRLIEDARGAFSKVKLAEIMHFTANGAKMSSKTLGVSAVTRAELGAALLANEEVLEKIKALCEIQKIKKMKIKEE